MAFINSLLSVQPRTAGIRRPRLIAFRFTTNGSGVPTLADNYDGELATPVQATNDYTVTVGPFEKVCACMVTTSVGVRDGLVANGAAGTVQIQFSLAQNSAIIDVLLVLDQGDL